MRKKQTFIFTYISFAVFFSFPGAVRATQDSFYPPLLTAEKQEASREDTAFLLEQQLQSYQKFQASVNPALPGWKKLAEFLYQENGIRVTSSADALLPAEILASKQASEWGMAGLLCYLAQENGISLHAAVFPGGVFLISRGKEKSGHFKIGHSELQAKPLDYFYRQAEWTSPPLASSGYFRALDSSELQALFLLALAETRLKNSQDKTAARLLKQARKNIPEIAAFYLLEGKLAYRGKEIPAAIRSFKKALSLHPKNLEAARYLANFFWSSGDLTQAQEYLEKILEVSGDDIPTLEKIIFLKVLRQGIPAEDADLDTLASLAPNNATALAMKYIWESLGGQKTAAQKTLRLFSRSTLDSPYPLLLLGMKPLLEGIHINPGFLWRAMEKFREADSRFPDNPYIHYLIGLNYFYGGDFHAAVSAFEKAIQLAPLFSEALLKKAQSHIYLGEFENAGIPLRRAEKNHPETPALAYTKALLAFHQGDLRQALEQIEEAVIRAPALEKSSWLITQAEIAVEANDTGRALRALDFAQDSGDFSAKLYELYGRIYFSEKQMDLAEKNLLQAVKAGTKSAKALQTLAQIYFQKKEYPLSWHYIRAAQRQGLQDPELMNALRQVSQEPESAQIKHEVKPFSP